MSMPCCGSWAGRVDALRSTSSRRRRKSGGSSLRRTRSWEFTGTTRRCRSESYRGERALPQRSTRLLHRQRRRPRQRRTSGVLRHLTKFSSSRRSRCRDRPRRPGSPPAGNCGQCPARHPLRTPHLRQPHLPAAVARPPFRPSMVPVSVHSAGRCGNPYRVTTAAPRYSPPGTSASAAALPRDPEPPSRGRPEHLPRVLNVSLHPDR